MIDFNFLNNYNGPNLQNCTLDGVDITEEIRTLYGNNNNWNSKIYTYSELFGDDSIGKLYIFKFINEDNYEISFNGVVNNINDYADMPIL